MHIWVGVLFIVITEINRYEQAAKIIILQVTKVKFRTDLKDRVYTRDKVISEMIVVLSSEGS